MVVQSWQRVPTTMLSEYCQREKRPRPQYSPARGGPAQGGGRRMQVRYIERYLYLIGDVHVCLCMCIYMSIEAGG